MASLLADTTPRRTRASASVAPSTNLPSRVRAWLHGHPWSAPAPGAARDAALLPAQRDFAAAYGRSAGGQIFIHGQPNALTEGREPGDWTDGCIALSDAEIEALWREVPDGTPIEIRP